MEGFQSSVLLGIVIIMLHIISSISALQFNRIEHDALEDRKNYVKYGSIMNKGGMYQCQH